MFGLSNLDLTALGWFLLAWGIHALVVERSEWRVRSLEVDAAMRARLAELDQAESVRA